METSLITSQNTNTMDWSSVNGIPREMTIAVIIKHNETLYAGGTYMKDHNNSKAKVYVSKDNGSTWDEFISHIDNLSSISTMLISDGRLIVAGRDMQVQLQWTGGMYYVEL